MKNNLYILYVLGLSLLVASCANDKGQTQQHEKHPIKVSVVSVDSVVSTVGRHYVGVVEEDYAASLSFTNMGYLEQVSVNEGMYVAEGDVIAQLDKRTAQSMYDGAKAKLLQAQDAYERLKLLYDEGGLAEVKWVEMQTNLKSAESMEQVARKTLEDTELVAPFAGIVGEKLADAGMNLLPMQPVLSLLDIDHVQVRFAIPENEVVTVTKGMNTRVTVGALNDKEYKGEISDRGVVADALSHSYEAKIRLANDAHALLPGMVCKVYVASAAEVAGFVLPTHVVQVNLDGHFVWVVEAGSAMRRMVQVGDYVPGGVLVISGLKVGDKVLTEGLMKVYEGADVSYE